MDYNKTAREVIGYLGGKENIETVTHCVTRVRFVVRDESKVELDAIKGVSGVLDCIVSSGQYQVVIGPAVNQMYEAVLAQVGTLQGAAPAQQTSGKRTVSGLAKQALDTLVSCFVPTIPLIAGSGMVKVLAVLLNYIGLLPADSTTYTLLNTVIGDGVFYFLPFFVAYNAAKKMQVDIALSMAMAAIVLHPNFSALAEAETAVTFLGIPVNVMGYSAQALPMIFGVWLLKYVDKLADRVSPNIVKVFLRPMIDLLIVAPVIMIVIGPAAILLSNIMFEFCTFMQSWGWIAVGINALLFPLMVITGTHNATIPLIVQMFATQGFDGIFLPCGMAANIAEAGAACAVALKTKNKELRATGLSATVSALLGITEPALYGVNLRMKRPFISMLLGAFVGGCYIGLVGLTAPSFVTPSLLTIAVFMGNGVNVALGLASIPFTFVVTFLITWFVGFKDLEPAGKQ